ncbi:hypothetical protein ACFZB4_23000 [Streptomyces pseudovenezuelae]|uniref:hypothetical protein n=1 Tax=Streptomyces pseudovenezuelae TaxID=67350 RepID=UPI0036EA1EE9
MNTERPDDHDPGEASGGESGSAAEAHGAGGASAAEQRGPKASGDEKTNGVGASRTEDTDAGAGPDRGAEGAEEASGAAEGSAGEAARVTDADADDRPAPDSGTAAEPDGAAVSSAALADEDAAGSPAAERAPASDAAAADLEGRSDRDEPRASDGADASGTRDEPSATDDAEPAVSAGQGAATDAAPGPAHSPDALPDSEIPRHEDADAPRPARHRSPVAIAAVAAAVLLVGGGGAYLAASASGGSGDETTSGASGDGTPPPLALDGYRAAGGEGNGIAPGEPNPYGVTYRVDGSLPDGPGSAPVYRVQGQVTEDDVTRLAEALGVDGTPVAQGQVWRVGVKDGSGPSLQVNRQAPGAWTFQRYSPVVDDCTGATVCGKEQTPTGRPVSEAVAENAAAPVLKAVGQGAAKLDASQVMGAQRVVNADPVVGGLPTYGWATGVTVNGQGEVVGGSGQLKAPVKSDTYPVLSAEKTLGLLNKVPASDHRMGIGGCASPVPLKDRLEAPCGESTASPAKSTLTVEKAVFGLASHFVGGRQALVPSWLFEVRATGAKDPFTVTYPAVDPKYIASPATATPTTPASPTAPSGRPSAAPKTRDVEVDGYTAEGDELTVSFTGGVCGDYTATASESGDEVRATVTYTPWPDKVCIMIAKEMQKTVPLDAPLGDRKVVGSDGKDIPLKKAGARLPETSGAR